MLTLKVKDQRSHSPSIFALKNIMKTADLDSFQNGGIHGTLVEFCSPRIPPKVHQQMAYLDSLL